MKLLVVSNMYPSKAYPSYGVFVGNFCKQLEQLRVDYALAVMQKHSGKLQKLLGYVAFYAKSFLLSLFGTYDAVYVHYASHSSSGVLLARKLRKFTVYTNVHGSDVIPDRPEQEKMQKNTRAILACSQKVIVPSTYFKRVVTEKYALPADKVFVCASGGVDPAVFYPRQNIQKNTVLSIGFAGRLSPGKGWETLLQACAKLPDREFRLTVVGDGPERPALQQRLEQLQLQDITTLYGLQPQQELARFYNEFDVLVFPTERAGESLGLVPLEAMACGCPVIASDYAAPADYMCDGVNGYKFPMRDADALSQALQKLRSLSEETYKALCDGAVETAQKYTRQTVTQELGKILLE